MCERDRGSGRCNRRFSKPTKATAGFSKPRPWHQATFANGQTPQATAGFSKPRLTPHHHGTTPPFANQSPGPTLVIMLTLSLSILSQQPSPCGPPFTGTNGDRPTLMTLPFVGMGKWVACRDSSDARSHPVVTHPPQTVGGPVSLRGVRVRQRHADGRTPFLLASACLPPSSSL